MSVPTVVEAWADAMAAVMGLTIEPEWRESVLANLSATAAVAEIVLNAPVEDAVEPAPVFEA